MPNITSYYDWESQFKKNNDKKKKKKNEVYDIKNNSLGIKDNLFREYLERWKSKNL